MNFLRSQVMQKAKRIRTRCALDVSRECFVRGYDGGHGGLTSFPVPQTRPLLATIWVLALVLHSFFLCAHNSPDKNVFRTFCVLFIFLL